MVFGASFSNGLRQNKSSQTRDYTHAWMVRLRTARGSESCFSGFTTSRILAEAAVSPYRRMGGLRRSGSSLMHAEIVETSSVAPKAYAVCAA